MIPLLILITINIVVQNNDNNYTATTYNINKINEHINDTDTTNSTIIVEIIAVIILELIRIFISNRDHGSRLHYSFKEGAVKSLFCLTVRRASNNYECLELIY